MVLIIPMMGIILIYVLETQWLLPQLAQNLEGDARLLVEITRSEYTMWGNPYLFEVLLTRVKLDPAIRMMFFSADGVLLYSSDSQDNKRIGQVLVSPTLDEVRQGEEVTIVHSYRPWQDTDMIDVFAPVYNSNQPVIGIVRVTYRLASVTELSARMRWIVAGVLLVGLLLGTLLGYVLALSIGRPIQRVTRALYDLARGDRREPLREEGPQETRDQIRATNYLVERLSGMEQYRRQLLANLVHELGRPLGALRSAIHALSRGAAQDPQLLLDLTVGMDEETRRLQNLLNELSTLHGQVLGTLELEREPVVINEWLTHLLRPWQEAALEKNLSWKTEIPADLPTLSVDPTRLAQAVGNLVSNAIKFTPPGGDVEVSAGVEKNQFWVRVRDSGPGIPLEEQEKIFLPFYPKTQGRRIKQGMGLGLSITHDLVTAHGGHIQVQSGTGQGSVFTIWIPVE